MYSTFFFENQYLDQYLKNKKLRDEECVSLMHTSKKNALHQKNTHI